MQDFTRSSGRSARDPRETSVVIGSYDDYADAEQVVDLLADKGFPVEHVTIIGRGMHLVERVTGRMSYLEAALRGALSGALAGALIGWLFFVFDWFDPVVARGWLIVDGLWFGALVGAAFGLIAHALLRGRRDFASIVGMEADRYDVLVGPDVAERALALLGKEQRFVRTDTPAKEASSAADVPSDPARRE